MARRLYLILILYYLNINIVYGQINRPNIFQANEAQLDTSFNEADSLINKNGFFSIFKGKPGRAALYSLLIPGGGQIYNKKWWKVPLAWGIDGGLTYVLISNRSNYRKTQEAYQTALATPGAENVSRLKQQRDFYRKWSEYAWIWLIAGHILTVADAYVDRHLMDFDVSDDLTFGNNYLYPYETQVSLRIGLSINLNRKKTSGQPILALSLP